MPVSRNKTGSLPWKGPLAATEEQVEHAHKPGRLLLEPYGGWAG